MIKEMITTRTQFFGTYRAPLKGGWGGKNWYTDPEEIARILAAVKADDRNETITVITETRLPSGRWGGRTAETFQVETKDLQEAKFRLLQAESRLHAARQAVSSAEVDLQVARFRLEELSSITKGKARSSNNQNDKGGEKS
jgi:hypothetical protein